LEATKIKIEYVFVWIDLFFSLYKKNLCK